MKWFLFYLNDSSRFVTFASLDTTQDNNEHIGMKYSNEHIGMKFGIPTASGLRFKKFPVSSVLKGNTLRAEPL